MSVVEMIVASAMAIALLAISSTLITSTVTDQPQLSKKAASIETARVVLYRLTREIRNGVAVDGAPTASSVSYRAYVRHSTCGGTALLSPGAPSTLCEITYSYCTGGKITRAELSPAQVPTSPCAAEPVITGLSSSNVFSYTPSPASATFIQMTLTLPNPSGPGNLTISDGSTLRNGTALTN